MLYEVITSTHPSTGTGTHAHNIIESASYATDSGTAMDQMDIEVLSYKQYSYPVALYRSFIDANRNNFV